MKYYREIHGFLDGTKLGISRDRLDWQGYTEVIRLYQGSPPNEQKKIAKAMTRIISESKDWGVVADVMHLAYSLKIKGSVEEAIKKLKTRKVGSDWRERVGRQRQTYIQSLDEG